MRRTAEELRDLIATLPDDAPVFAEVWTPEDLRVRLLQWMESPDEVERTQVVSTSMAAKSSPGLTQRQSGAAVRAKKVKRSLSRR